MSDTQQQIQKISIDLIDAPQNAMRSNVNDEDIDELANSIKIHGLLQPITLRPVNGRYEIVAGHRRFIACRRLGLAKIDSIVRDIDSKESTILMVHENLLRRDVNPVDEAVFLSKVMKENGLDIKGMCELINRSETYLRDRLDILSYPDYLIEAVGNKQIGLIAASWLNKITDERVRSDYVRYAILGGLTTTRAVAWFRSWEAGNIAKSPEQLSAINPLTGQTEIKYTTKCVLCGADDETRNLMLYYAHEGCYHQIKQ